jgi:nucleotide sugar dehydrogenase
MSSAEAAEFAKLADTTYRDVNIALANEFARYADRIGVDVTEVIAAANSQPYSHIHQPGLGVGGHCIPVYPHFLLDRAPELELVALARRTNDGQVRIVLDTMAEVLGGLEGCTVLVLGLTYRHGVKELAYSRALPLITGLLARGAHALAYDPLLSADEVGRTGAKPWGWGDRAPEVAAIVSQTADPMWLTLEAAWFPGLRFLVDGRNSLGALALPDGVEYRGIGVSR